VSEPGSQAAAGTDDPGKQYRAAAGIPVIPALDGFRAAAIFGIVALHLAGGVTGSVDRTIVSGVFPNMVDLLFIISGFVVFLPTVARGGRFGSVGGYAIRRAARLLPAYWLAIGVVLAVLAFWPADPKPAIPPFLDVGAHLFGVQTYGHLLDGDFNLGLVIDGPLWTLSLELTFYLVLPFIAAWYFRRPLLGLALAAAVTVLWKLGFSNLREITSWLGFAPDPRELASTELRAVNQFPSFAFQFGLGMTAAWAYVRYRAESAPKWLESRAVLIQIGSLLVLGFCMYLFGRNAIDSPVLAPSVARQDILLSLVLPAAMTAFVLATCFAPRRFQIPFALPFARRLGDISYGVYLIHLPILFLIPALFSPEVVHIGPIDGSLALAIIALPLAILYGYLSARFLEQPIRRWAHRFGRRGSVARERDEVPGEALRP